MSNRPKNIFGFLPKEIKMLQKSLVAIFIGIFLSVAWDGFSLASGSAGDDRKYHRIVSMSPGVTETLFALGLGAAVVGVTRYCDYPPEVRTRARVGGFYDPNYEAIVSLKPDLVVLVASNRSLSENLEKLDIKTLVVENDRIEDICRSIETIGRFCGAVPAADRLLAKIRQRMDAVKTNTVGLPRPGVMISVDRSTGTTFFNEVYVAGKNNFYDELIALAGGINVCGAQNIRYPVLSAEGIIRLNPEVIIDIMSDYEKRGLKIADIRDEWNRFCSVSAVKNRRVYVFGEHFTAIPGPRFVLTLEALAKVLHPEVAWEK